MSEYIGFFGRTEHSNKKNPLPLLPSCGACGLNKTCISPMMQPCGRGQKKILIVGEAPGKTEDMVGKPFVGKSGRYLEQALRQMKIDLSQDCWITNALICRPPKNNIPNDRVIGYCRPNVVNLIKKLQPKVTILLGHRAVQSVIGWLWKEAVGPIGKWVDWTIPCQEIDSWLCPAWHPAWLLREIDSGHKKDSELKEMLFFNCLQRAISLPGRPSEMGFALQPPKVETYAAAAFLSELMNRKEPIAFDFETDRKKPDHPEATILIASVSDGKRTVSFPVYGENKDHISQLLSSDVPKIGWNISFENRWSLRVLGHPVNNWIWDGMLAAHALDNRTGITGLKFQSFVKLGVQSYDDELKPLMRVDGGNEKNNLHQASLDKLMHYCGLDSYYTYCICMKQMKEMSNE